MDKSPAMSSNRPYLLRALYEWINDNNLTPYILADATYPDVLVPKSSVKDGKVVLNFGTQVVWVGFDSKQARQLAESIRQASYRAEGK